MANELDTDISVIELSASVLPLLSTKQSMADKVKHKLQDDSYTIDDITEVLYEGLVYIAGVVLLDELETTVDIDTDPGLNYTALPADYHRKLIFCHSTSHNRPVRIWGSVVQLFNQHSNLDQTGYVHGVAAKGRRLYYQRVPSSAETLRITYFRYPDRQELLDKKPVCLPPHLADPLLVNYALRELFDEIEDALEGPKVNTTHYGNRFNAYLAELIRFVGPEERLPQKINDTMMWDHLFT